MSWQSYNQSLLRYPQFGFSLDLSLMDIDAGFLSLNMEPKIATSLRRHEGARRRCDRQPRRRPHGRPLLAAQRGPRPHAGVEAAITGPHRRPQGFRRESPRRRRHPAQRRPFPTDPAHRHRRLGARPATRRRRPRSADARLPIFFFDNTDPDGMDAVLARVAANGLDKTLVLVISKSGGTPETRNGMLEAKAAWEAAGLDFGKHAVAVTGAVRSSTNSPTQQQLHRPFPDGGLGRRPHLGAVHRRPRARRAAGRRHRPIARRRRRHG